MRSRWDTRTKLPRSAHCPALEKLAPGPVAAAHTPAPGGDAAQLPASEAPPACDKYTYSGPVPAGGGEGGGGCRAGMREVLGRDPGRNRSGVTRRLVVGLMGDSGGAPKRREGGVTYVDGLES